MQKNDGRKILFEIIIIIYVWKMKIYSLLPYDDVPVHGVAGVRAQPLTSQEPAGWELHSLEVARSSPPSPAEKLAGPVQLSSLSPGLPLPPFLSFSHSPFASSPSPAVLFALGATPVAQSMLFAVKQHKTQLDFTYSTLLF